MLTSATKEAITAASTVASTAPVSGSTVGVGERASKAAVPRPTITRARKTHRSS